MNAYVIGSISNVDKIEATANFLKTLEYDEVYYVKPNKSFKPLSELITDCFNTIDKVDHIYAVSKKDGTFGDGVLYEMEYARRLGKKIIRVEPQNLDNL